MNDIEKIVSEMDEESKEYHLFNSPFSNVSNLIKKQREEKELEEIASVKLDQGDQE